MIGSDRIQYSLRFLLTTNNRVDKKCKYKWVWLITIAIATLASDFDSFYSSWALDYQSSSVLLCRKYTDSSSTL